MNRRNFLKGIGASALLTPTLSKRVLAQGNQSIKRFIVCFTYHGVVYDHWKMHGTQGEGYWETELPSTSGFSHALQPLASFANQLMVIDGLALVSAEADGNSGGTRHENGTVHALTGNYGEMVSEFPMASSASIDQLISTQISDSGQFYRLGVRKGWRIVKVDDYELIPAHKDKILQILRGGKGKLIFIIGYHSRFMTPPLVKSVSKNSRKTN